LGGGGVVGGGGWGGPARPKARPLNGKKDFSKTTKEGQKTPKGRVSTERGDLLGLSKRKRVKEADEGKWSLLPKA